jgi:(+)-neomenthol dehydrogenase
MDILVNNAGISGILVDPSKASESYVPGEFPNFLKLATQNLEYAIECISINYYGVKRMIEAFVPLLQKSKSPRIVNVSAGSGQLNHVPDGKTKEVLADAGTLTEEKIDEVIDGFLKDVKEDSLKAKGWSSWSAYIISKAAVNAYTRILARKYQNIKVNAVCPGYVKTDINYNSGVLTIEEGAASPVKLALLPDDGPSGLFFSRGEVAPF